MRERDVCAIVDRVLDCRRTLQGLHGDHYPPRVEPWKAVLRAVSALPPGRSVLQAALDAAQRGQDPIATLWLLAAAADLIDETAPRH